MSERLLMRLLRGKEKNISKDCFLWNTIAGGVNAAEAVVLMMVITRTNGVEAAGILSIAFAVGNLLMTIGKFGVRNYQVTDVKQEYSFNSYYTLRVYSVLIMAFISIGYIVVKTFQNEYTFSKAIVVLGICLIYVIESFEDVFLGYYQQMGRLDIASKIFIIRWLLIMLVFIVISIWKKDLLLAILTAMLVSLICEIVLIRETKEFFKLPQLKIEVNKLMPLVRQCFSLFLVAFLTYYVTNAPKYAIDQYLTEDIQAYFGYISMPVFVVELLNCFLYQPQMVNLANDWSGRKYKDYNRRVYKQYIIIICLTIFCALGAYLLGIPVLSILYGVGLENYRKELVILMIAGGALAFVGYTSVLLTIMRKQKLLLYNMIVITILAIAGFGKVVQGRGMIGAAIYYLILMCILAFMNYCCTIAVEYKCKKKNEISV